MRDYGKGAVEMVGKKWRLWVHSIVILSFVFLFYIRYYAQYLYYHPQLPLSHVFDGMYRYVAYPGFWFFFGAYISSLIMEMIGFSLSKNYRFILRVPLVIAFLLVFIVLPIANLFFTFPISFVSSRSVIFGLVGCLLAVTVGDVSEIKKGSG